MIKISGSNSRNGQNRRRLSFPRVVVPMGLVAIAILSLIGVMTGMHHVTQTLSLPPQMVMSMSRTSPTDDSRHHSNGDAAIAYSRGRDRVDTTTYNKDKRLDIHDMSSRRIIFFQVEEGAWIKQPHLRRQSNTTKRVINVSKHTLREQARLLDSEDFSYRDPLYEGECIPMAEWQTTSFPNCNMFHELDFYGKVRRNEMGYFTSGGYNDIFHLNERDIPADPDLALKILMYETDHTDRNYDRVRRDGLILERLTKSPYIMNAYGFCGFAVMTPYAHGGTLSSKLNAWHKGKLELPPETRLQFAVNVSAGLAAVHDIDGEGLSSVAHGDLKGQQFLFLNDEMKLGDFNRGRFLRRNVTNPQTACTYTIGNNDATFRSPEEYLYEPQTSAIDVYALGSIFYKLLTGNEVWHDTDEEEARKYITEGQLPKIDDELVMSEHPVDVALREAMSMCYVFDPKGRASAADVAAFLKSKLSQLKL